MADTQVHCSHATFRRSSHLLLTPTTQRTAFASSPSRVYFDTPKTKVLAMAVKRSPKRLKYIDPHFTKVFFSSFFLLFIYMSYNWCSFLLWKAVSETFCFVFSRLYIICYLLLITHQNGSMTRAPYLMHSQYFNI